MKKHRRKKFEPFLIILAVSVLLSLFIINRNALFHFVRPSSGIAWAHQIKSIEIKMGPIISTIAVPRLIPVKVSFPISYSDDGCEFIYGAAIARQFPNASLATDKEGMRFIFKFKYDSKNSRCESKDLAFSEGFFPRELTLQFVRVRIGPERIRETPDPESILISYRSENKENPFVVESKSFQERYPYFVRKVTERNVKFSTNPVEGELTPLILPYDDLKSRIIMELQSRKKKCRELGICDSISSVVAATTDPEIHSALHEAREAGLDVEVITSFNPTRQAISPNLTTGSLGVLSWTWLRGNPYQSDYPLPMHAKFMIFGSDLVLSTNSNYSFDLSFRSREAGVEYRNKNIVSMFKEAFALVRTSLFYPVKVDLKDNFMLLVNADRPPHYTTTARKPYLSIQTPEVRDTSAYGIVFHLMQQSKGKLDMIMSPLSNHCYSYGRRLCLGEVLREKAENSKLRLILNAFYSIHHNFDPLYHNDIYWSKGSLKHLFQPRMQLINEIFDGTPSSPEIYMTHVSSRMGNHHERLALLGNDLTFSGSANYASPTTFNTIEVIRDVAFQRHFRAELNTFNEPYFVVSAKEKYSWNTIQGDCDFIFERDLNSKTDFKPKTYLGRDLEAEAFRKAGLKSLDEFDLVLPDMSDPKTLRNDGPRELKFMRNRVQETVESYGSYFCLENRKTRKNVILRISSTEDSAHFTGASSADSFSEKVR